MAGLHYLIKKDKVMKKVMFIIIGMLFSVSVNAATLSLVSNNVVNGVDGNFGSVELASGNVVTADWSGSATGGESFTDKYTVTTNELSGGYLSVTFNPLIGTSIVSLDDGSGAFTLPSVSASKVAYFWVLAAGTTYDISIKIVDALKGSNYDLRIETPIPAALFLFAPALLGFFGLRRKAAVAA